MAELNEKPKEIVAIIGGGLVRSFFLIFVAKHEHFLGQS